MLVKKWLKIAKNLFLLILVLFFISYIFLPKPEFYQIDYSTIYFDRNGKLLKINLSSADNYRIYTDLSQINPDYIKAVILYEDKYFYYHFGVNPSSLIRSAYASLVGGRLYGGSTISMQVARMYFGLKTNNVRGKLWQIYRALQIERHYSKEQILTAYINLLPFGGNIYGIEAASRIYFNRSAKDLNLPQIITLATIPQNPTKRKLSLTENCQTHSCSYHAKRNLAQIWQKKYGKNKLLESLTHENLAISDQHKLPNYAPHLTDYLSLHAAQLKLTNRVITSIDLNLQTNTEQIVQSYLYKKRKYGLDNAAVLIVNARSMEVESILGSANFFDSKIHGQVNGVLANRSPGSSLKPFVYALALEQGLIHPKTMLADVPGYYGAYQPENFDKKYYGLLNATQALIYSRNLPAINLQTAIMPDLYDFLQAGEAKLPHDKNYYGMGIVLGGVDISMAKLVELYASLANFGDYRELSYIKNAKNPLKKHLLTPEASYLTLDMLNHNKLPIGIKRDDNFYAWKTGTSYNFRDAWTIGVVNDYIVAVWLGNFDSSPNPNLIGISAATPLWFELAKYLVDNKIAQHKIDYAMPLGIRTIKICDASGDLPSKFCPSLSTTTIIDGVTKLRVENVFRQVKIDKITGLRLCDYELPNPSSYIKKTFAFWSLDIQNLYARAGINIEKPPKYKTPCSIYNDAVENLKIILPNAKTRLAFNVKTSRAKILFKGFSRDTEKIYWFLDDKFIGTSTGDEVLTYYLNKTGKFKVKAIDDMARVATTQLIVESIY